MVMVFSKVVFSTDRRDAAGEAGNRDRTASRLGRLVEVLPMTASLGTAVGPWRRS